MVPNASQPLTSFFEKDTQRGLTNACQTHHFSVGGNKIGHKIPDEEKEKSNGNEDIRGSEVDTDDQVKEGTADHVHEATDGKVDAIVEYVDVFAEAVQHPPPGHSLEKGSQTGLAQLLQHLHMHSLP